VSSTLLLEDISRRLFLKKNERDAARRRAVNLERQFEREREIFDRCQRDVAELQREFDRIKAGEP
jgi:hypothetical protein